MLRPFATARLAFALAPFIAACGTGPGAAGADSARPLPAYTGIDARKFDDGIDPHAVGLELETYAAPKDDPRIRARALASDIVVRAHVSTVTGEVVGANHSYQLDFQTVERLAGNHPVGDEFVVRIDSNSPSLGIVRSMEGALVGKTLVVFVKTFGHDGDKDLHFHASADGAEMIAAVKDAVILDEVK